MSDFTMTSHADETNVCFLCGQGSVWRFEFKVNKTHLKLWYCEEHTEYIKQGISAILGKKRLSL